MLGQLQTASLSQISSQMGRIQDGSRRLPICKRFSPKTLREDQAVHNRSHHLSPSPPSFLRDFLCYVFLCYPASKEAGRQKPGSTASSRLVKFLLEACPRGLGGDPASPPRTARHRIHLPAARVLLQTGVLQIQLELLPRLLQHWECCGKGERQGTAGTR